MDSSNEDFNNLLTEVDMFVDEMMIRDMTSNINLDTIYSLYRRWCTAHDKSHIDHYYFKRQISKEITFVDRTPYINGLKINTERVKDLRISERKKRQN